MELPRPCLVVLVGASGAGKTTWAAARFAAGEIVSSDRLRAAVGEAEDDLAASDDAFALVDAIVTARLARGLSAVIDTTGLDARRRATWRALAERYGVPAVAVVLTAPPAVLVARGRARPRPVPQAVVRDQAARVAALADALADEFGAVHVVDTAGAGDPAPRAAQHVAATVAPSDGLRFGLHLSRFDWPDGPAGLRDRLLAIAAEAEAAGFDSLWAMDHLRQIPQVGRPWEDLPDAPGLLAFLAAVTERVRLGALVSPLSLRSVPLVARSVATLDVLSGGRAVCGIGAGWFADEHVAAGVPFAPLRARLDLVEDAARALPLLFGPGGPPFRGRVLDLPETALYPRPLQQRVPLLVGGQGERRTLAIVAAYADACNLFGPPERVAAKLAVLRGHCAGAGRDPAAIEVTHLSTALAAPTADDLARLVALLRPGRAPVAGYAATAGAGTTAELVARFAALRDAGVQTAIVRLADLGREPGAIARFAPVIATLGA